MDISSKPQFIPQIQDENVDIKTALIIFSQIVSENVGTKKLSIYYFKQDDECIFDEVKELLKKLSIELSITFVGLEDFFNVSLMFDRPHIIYLDNILEDPVNRDAVVSTIPPSSFIISRGIKVEGFTDDYYVPMYVAGKGKDRLEMSQWKIVDIWKQISLRTHVSLVLVKSVADLDEVRKALKNATKFKKVILIAKYPDVFGLKEMVQEVEREEINLFVVFTDTEVTEAEVKQRLKFNIPFSVLHDGIWGGEYYVPVKNA
ncbi:uncharacterized protein LOC106137079 [Amyelois transitella]|uniref:uncharacterized protein LOC106137079 n=1 Tax=Amyelois transitella TaxID=680683 RepID=UPI00067DC39F|nr:uncharacterized protein LOC106137079 [Amyelois transitella]XP_013193288.1 uncharacterized protein LOC106137079 [Amyelois transitella]XP_060806529.1 uncharacterized protein LOC106137079 [Amyelois transitella]XP_060806530.1 uncharacterized protein LOC106137079 [Amyelois transitella]